MRFRSTLSHDHIRAIEYKLLGVQKLSTRTFLGSTRISGAVNRESKEHLLRSYHLLISFHIMHDYFNYLLRKVNIRYRYIWCSFLKVKSKSSNRPVLFS